MNSAASKKTITVPGSLHEIQHKIKEGEQKQENKLTKEKTQRKKLFTKEELTEVWNKYIEQRLQLGKEQEVVFLKQKWELNHTTITIAYHNAVLANTFNAIKIELLAYLRDSLQNDSITLDIHQVDTPSEKMIYTNKEKFEHLSDLYPDVKLLQQKLNLDPDF